MSALTDVQRVRLARLLGMTGSAHDGEALNAARLADRLVRDAGITWVDVVSPAAPALPPSPVHRVPHWRVLAQRCAERPGCLTVWERSFVASLLGRASVSAKQRNILHDIAERLGVLEAA